MQQRIRPALRICADAPSLEHGLMKSFAQSVWRFLAEEDGPTAVEYAAMGGLIIAVVIGAVSGLGQGTLALYVKSANAMP